MVHAQTQRVVMAERAAMERGDEEGSAAGRVSMADSRGRQQPWRHHKGGSRCMEGCKLADQAALTGEMSVKEYNIC